MELQCLFTRQQTLKLGYYYRLLVSSQTFVKGGHGFDIAVRI